MSSPIRLQVETSRQSELLEITRDVEQAIDRLSQGRSGIVVIYVPHTTAGVVVQENADPDVQHDLLRKLDELVPRRESYYRHAEGNSDSHLKAVMCGTSVTLIVEAGKPLLGRWQGIYLAEFDGPRSREVVVKVILDKA